MSTKDQLTSLKRPVVLEYILIAHYTLNSSSTVLEGILLSRIAVEGVIDEDVIIPVGGEIQPPFQELQITQFVQFLQFNKLDIVLAAAIPHRPVQDSSTCMTVFSPLARQKRC